MVKIFRSKTSFKAFYHQLNIWYVLAWYPHSMEPEIAESFICSKINGGWIGQIVWKQVPQQVNTNYGKICPHLGDMEISVHYYNNQVYKCLFKDVYILKLKFWPSGHCEWISLFSILGCIYIYQRHSIPIIACLLRTFLCWLKIVPSIFL